MKIIISPAKKINDKQDFNYKANNTKLLDETIKLYDYLKSLNKQEIAKTLKISNKILDETYNNLSHFKINEGYITALFAYDGIQYKYMNPTMMDSFALDYLDHNLLILNALYGANKAFDLIIPHRLEMQTNFIDFNMYDYWQNKIVTNYIKDEIVVNLASNEYTKAVLRYLNPNQIINISFKEIEGNQLIEKGVYVKMARGLMVRYMAENNIDNLEDIKNFNEMNYQYNEELSTKNHYIFTRR